MNFTPILDRNEKIKEAYAILTQGIEIKHHHTNRKSKKFTILKKIFWMDPDSLRLCLEKTRPSLAERSLGKVPFGVYIKDLAEIRQGINSHDFQQNKIPPDPMRCLSLIASETTICLEFPSKFTRDWFFERFHLIKADIIPSSLLQFRIPLQSPSLHPSQLFSSPSPVFDPTKLEETNDQELARFSSLLVQGFQVLHHHPSGHVIRSVLSLEQTQTLRTPLTQTPPSSSSQDLDQGQGLLRLRAVERKYWWEILAPLPDTVLPLSDICELRIQGHSLGFARTRSLHPSLGGCLLSLVGSGGVMDLQLASQESRDVLLVRLTGFLRRRSKGEGEYTHPTPIDTSSDSSSSSSSIPPSSQKQLLLPPPPPPPPPPPHHHLHPSPPPVSSSI